MSKKAFDPEEWLGKCYQIIETGDIVGILCQWSYYPRRYINLSSFIRYHPTRYCNKTKKHYHKYYLAAVRDVTLVSIYTLRLTR